MNKSPEAPRKITNQAPVLFIPNVLDREFCQTLINVWETEGNQESYSMIEHKGELTPIQDDDYKRRRDHFLQEGETHQRLRYFIRQQVRPAIKKAFHFEITRFESFRIGCYDANTGGYFRPHRDDATEGTAYRRFAMTINLNVEDYEGGYLRFPEYGLDLYQPETGSALIFSCSLLHEVTDVIKGQRFALLSFFHGEHEAQLVEEYNRRVMVS
ncbi:MAG: 2OG-Fe(II) oxygenase [Moorea sp. SIO4A3]|nr:2OG-Fe(II) oxygenase [Moorena sp. SIO4A3]